MDYLYNKVCVDFHKVQKQTQNVSFLNFETHSLLIYEGLSLLKCI